MAVGESSAIVLPEGKEQRQGSRLTQRRVIRKQPNSRMCLVCGFRNAAGLKASFYEAEKSRQPGPARI